MAAELAHKKSVRSGHRGTVTRKVTELETALGATPLDRDSLEQLRAALAEKVAVLKDLDESILALLEDEAEIETDIEGAEVIRDTLRSALFKIDKAIGPPSGAPRGVSPTVGDTPSESVATRIKLPELTLTPFDGDYTKWKTFWDSFESAIHNRRDLSDIDKFTYLRSLLIRSAKEAVAGLSLTSSNYQEAIDILKKRFGDESQIITKHMEAFTGLEAVTDNQNLSALRRLYDKVEIHVRGLRSLGIAHSAYGALLTPLLMRKLPQELRVLISRKMSGKEWEFNPILAALLEEIEARERAGIIHKSSNAYTRTKRESATATTLTTKDSGHSECCYCSEKHEPSLCKNVVLIEPRKQILKGRGYCFNCLRKGHRVRDCRAPPKCTECKSKHHPSICLKAVKSESSKETLNLQVNVSNLNPEAPPFTSLSSTSQAEENDTVLLQTVRVTAFNPSNPALCREAKVILDSGSQRSYVTQDLKKEMALKVKGKKSMSIAAFGSTTQREEEYDIVEIGLRTEEGSIILRLLAVPLICGPIPAAPIEISKRYYEHLSNLDLAVSDEGEPQILIGLDYYWSVVSGEVIQASSGPSALYTKFGWVLSGPMSGIMHDSSAALITHVLKVETGPTNREIDKRLRSFWDLESLGIVDTEEAVYEQLSSHISLCNGRYKLSLPWKDPCASVPDNFSLSKRRLLSLLKRLRKTPDLLIEYDRVIQHQKQMGIVELIEDPSRQDGNRVHYLPHHAIIRKDRETSKVRIVYDASASENGPSLNACLHTGPKFNQKIMEILLRFRVHKVALAADIEKAFLMITIDKRDRDVLRFLWIDDLYKDPPFFIVLRFTRVVFGVTSSPFLLNATIKFHLESLIESNRKLVNKLLRSFYVDDLVTGAKTEEEAFLLYSDAKDLMKKGGFNLCKFCSNSEVLQKKIDLLERRVSGPSIVDNEEKTYAQSVLQNSQKSSEGEKKILGVLWNVISDDIVLNFCNIFDKANESEPSKRHIVSLAGRFYDPLGLAAPVIIKFKVLVQELCRAKVQWDETLTGKLLERWQLLVKEFGSCQPIRIPRCYTQSLDDVESFQLVGFCDASSVAYAAVVYLRMRSGEMTITRLLASKTRVAPIQTQTIPRLELLGALLLSRLIGTITNSLGMELSLAKPVCYTDSQVALFWIKGIDKDWKPFVHNRVTQIRSLVPISCWRHCPGKDNPADLPSRGISPADLGECSLWWNGPPWYSCEIGDRTLIPPDIPSDCVSELKSQQQNECGLLIIEKSNIATIMNINNYRNLAKLLKITSLLILFIYKLSKRVIDGSTKSQALIEAEQLWLLEVQDALVIRKDFQSLKKQLDLFCDERGIWRCGGRISNSDFSYATKHPIVLPREHPYTLLTIKAAHARVFHNGVKETLTELRAKYWVVKARLSVKTVISSCNLCRRYGGLAYKAPPPPPLPSFRVTEHPPFSYTGVDYAGPLYVKPDYPAQARCEQKVWICLYTCCITRAVHIDIVSDLSTPSFLRSLKRFISRRGLPLRMISDNGSTFKAAARVLQKIVTDDSVSEYLTGMKIEWSFNIEKAPWWGGIFERMIGLTKKCLRKTIGRAKFTYDELLTAVTEIESVLNSRPLSYISSSDLEEPLTPFHLLVGRRLSNLPDQLCYRRVTEEYTPESSSIILNKRLQHLHLTLDKFWSRWKLEYILNLRERYNKQRQRCHSKEVKIDDIVIIHDENTPRGFWKLGRIKELIVGRDKEIRGAVVCVLSRNKASLLRRPIQHLIPLEIHVDEGDISTNMEQSVSTSVPIETNETQVDMETTTDKEEILPESTPVIRDRPKRAAAIEARDKIIARLY